MIITGSPRSPVSVNAGRGDSISIAASSLQGPWTLRVWALVGGLEVAIGELTFTGGHPSRLVGAACVPGAEAWRVQVFGPEQQTAEVTVSTSPYPLARAGVVAL